MLTSDGWLSWCSGDFDQPSPIPLRYESPNGRPIKVWHTPDFFVVRETEAGWEEWKTEQDLEHLSERNL
jgi:hypothetical protein